MQAVPNQPVATAGQGQVGPDTGWPSVTNKLMADPAALIHGTYTETNGVHQQGWLGSVLYPTVEREEGGSLLWRLQLAP